jgi:serine/threonine protein kinase
MPDSSSSLPPGDSSLPELTDSAVGGLLGGATMRVPQTEVVLRHEGTELARKTLPPGEYVIGRGGEADVRGEALLLSTEHARLTINYDHCLLEDLGSSNGTFVAGERIGDSVRLFPNQDIKLGDVHLEIHRQRVGSTPGISLAPAQAAIQHLVPEEVLTAKRYAIGQQVARGGMGAILDAQQSAMKRHVAMKVMLEGSDAGDIARFVDEAQITGQLEHPNIVPVHELGVDENDQLFYTMKFVRGTTLKKVLDLLVQRDEASVKKYPLAALLTIFQKACDAIAFAHSKGVIHRDLKPENLMLGDFGEVLVMDWGLAKVFGGHRAVGASLPGTDGAVPSSIQRSIIASARGSAPEFGQTMAGTILGTPAYMAPEQARGEVETMDQRADLYSLGAILFEILHLRPPLTGDDPMAIVERAERGEIEWALPDSALRNPHSALPPSLLAVCRKALARDPAHRYRRVADLQADIGAYQNGFATSAENAGMWKQTTLLVKRHKGIFATVAAAWLVITALAVWFVINVTHAKNQAESQRNIATSERNRAEQNLADLRATAPTFFNQARLLTEQEKFDEALEKIGIALKLDPDNASFHAQHGNILQSQERFAEAAAEYDAAAKLNAQEPHAAENAALSRALVAAQEKEGQLSTQVRADWRDALTQQGRVAEAIFAGRSLGGDFAKMLPAWQAKIDAWLGQDAPRVKIITSNAGYDLNLSNRSLTDLSPLRGMPLHSLTISGNPHLSDIGPLADCTLAGLVAKQLPELVDLSPLKGKKLTQIDFSASGIRDLSPLAGMPLESVTFAHTAVTDLTPLRGTKLKHLVMVETPARDLEALRGQPLVSLDVSGVPIASLDPVGDAPLTYLHVSTHVDLASLRQRRLRSLLTTAAVDHLEVITEMTELEVLLMPANFSDPAPLRKLTHLRKIDFGEAYKGRTVEQLKDAADFFRQYDSPEVRAVRAALARVRLTNVLAKDIDVDPTGRLRVHLARTAITDLSSLRGLPINQLWLADTAVSDLEPLRGMPLDKLTVDRTRVASLEPLRGMPLKVLQINEIPFRDVSLLAEIPTLEEILLPKNARNVNRLRVLKNLRYISTRFDNGTPGHPAQTAEEFWKEFDTKKGEAGK